MRQSLVLDFHRRARVRLPNEIIHAAVHVVVENQIAAGDPLSTGRALARLTAGGLDRHEALHAIASVLTDQIHDILQGGKAGPFPQDDYAAAVDRLGVEDWFRRWHSDKGTGKA
jgi:hypothetical protein